MHCASKCVLPLSVDFVVAPCTIGNWCELYVEICNVFVVQAGWTVHVVLLVDSTQLDFCDSVNRYEVVHDSLVKPFLVNLLYFFVFYIVFFYPGRVHYRHLLVSNTLLCFKDWFEKLYWLKIAQNLITCGSPI